MVAWCKEEMELSLPKFILKNVYVRKKTGCLADYAKRPNEHEWRDSKLSALYHYDEAVFKKRILKYRGIGEKVANDTIIAMKKIGIVFNFPAMDALTFTT
jgi:hypothetical protein